MNRAWRLGAPLALASLVAGLFAFTRVETWRIDAANPPAGVFVPVEGGRVHLIDRMPAGPPRATVVLLHGASGNARDMLLPLGDRLTGAGFRVVAVDRPGLGWSDRLRGRDAASPAVQATIVAEALRAHGVTRAIVVGHSLAGAMSVNLALDHADLVQGLVLLAPVTHPWPGGIAWYYEPAASDVVGPVFTNLVTLPLGLAVLPEAVESVFAPQAVPDGYRAATGIDMALRPASFMANSQDVAALKAFVTAQAPRMGAITAPTAILAGDRDEIVSTNIHAVASHAAIAGSTLTILPGVGHAVQHAVPDLVAAAVEDVARRAGVPETVSSRRP